MPVNLADNSEVLVAVHEAIILWDGEEREVRVFATGRRPSDWNCFAGRARTCDSVH